MPNKVSFIDGALYRNMMKAGAQSLQRNVEKINALNVFPVPDGDTGTNMNMTFMAGINEMDQVKSTSLSDVSKAMARGLLMGARGNSGVILSQLFRGFSKYVEGKDVLSADEFAQSLKSGVDLAYKAIMKPIEGTILTVSKDAANEAIRQATLTDDLVELMSHVLTEAKASLRRTQEILPILKQVGVVDSGGQGLVNVYEGMLAVLSGEEVFHTTENDAKEFFSQSKEQHVEDEIAELMSQGVLSVDDIEFGYCTEFMILRNNENTKAYNDIIFTNQLSQFGDSLLVISDDELIKVHIHAEQLNEVFYLAQQYGELTKIKIENMREQFRNRSKTAKKKEKSRYGVIAIGAGEGIKDLFLSLGVDYVVQGGQTMNPSTEDIVKAIETVNAETVFILPNNSNIILTAEQASLLVDNRIYVIPSKTIQQGLSAMLQFNPDAEALSIVESMIDVLPTVNSGQITFSVRDTEIDSISIKKGDFMGIDNGKIVLTNSILEQATIQLIDTMIRRVDGELVTLIHGEDVSKKDVEYICEAIEDTYPGVEIEIHFGGQPVYPYLISVE